MINKVQLCGYHPNSDACKGESGGPLTTKVGQHSYQVGVTSYGNPECGQKK